MNRKGLIYIIIGIFLILGILIIFQMTGANTSPSIPLELDEPQITVNDAQIGPAGAPHQLVLFGYVGCEYCEDMQTTLREIQVDHADDILLVWKDYPNTSLASQSAEAAEFLRCAQDQDAFWEAQPFLFNRGLLTNELYSSIIKEFELNEKKFQKCLDKDTGLDLVNASIAEGNALSITATPTTYIDGVRYTGLLTERELLSILDL